MDISSVSTANIPSTDQLGTVRGAAQIEVLKKAMDTQAQQAAQLVQSVAEPPKSQPGQPGSVINTFA